LIKDKYLRLFPGCSRERENREINMKTYRIEITLTEDGVLTLKDLPFQAGDAVEIMILEHDAKPLESKPCPLRH
jgi:hypothetical protein